MSRGRNLGKGFVVSQFENIDMSGLSESIRDDLLEVKAIGQFATPQRIFMCLPEMAGETLPAVDCSSSDVQSTTCVLQRLRLFKSNQLQRVLACLNRHTENCSLGSSNRSSCHYTHQRKWIHGGVAGHSGRRLRLMSIDGHGSTWTAPFFEVSNSLSSERSFNNKVSTTIGAAAGTRQSAEPWFVMNPT